MGGARAQCRGAEEHFVPHGEANVPPVRVELLLAPVLPLLQQRPHLGRDAPHQVRNGLTWAG